MHITFTGLVAPISYLILHLLHVNMIMLIEVPMVDLEHSIDFLTFP